MAQPPILTLTDISLTFGGNPLFEQASLAIHPGERTCLVGRNGSGKSTLMKLMAGLVEPDSGSRFVRPGMSVAYMEQEPDFTGFANLRDFAEYGLDAGDVYRAEIALETVRLNGDLSPAQASGGELRRAALARLLAADADLMLIDEPTNHLDIRLIDDLEKQLNTTRKAFVLISHDRAFLRNLTRSSLWVDRGQLRRLDKGFTHFEEWRDKAYDEEDLERHKLKRLIKAESRWAVEGISGRRKRNMGRVGRLHDMREVVASQINRSGTANMAFEAGKSSGKLVIEATEISKRFDEQSILHPFSVRIQRGERVALIGPNGAGKTTLLKMLIGELAPDSGTVRLGSNLQSVVFDQARASIPQNVSLWDALVQDDELGAAGRNDQIMVRGTPRHVVGYLKDFLFTEAQARGPVSALSGGERARLLLARLMARESNLLILDEPTNDLDVETLDLLQEVISDYDGTVLLVSHDRDFIDRIATTTIAMEGDGDATIYAGGYTDYRAQRRGNEPVNVSKKARKNNGKKSNSPASPAQVGLNFAQEHRLKLLPVEIETLESEIAKLETLLADPDLFTNDLPKFEKATEALILRHDKLSTAEEEWLELESLRETAS